MIPMNEKGNFRGISPGQGNLIIHRNKYKIRFCDFLRKQTFQGFTVRFTPRQIINPERPNGLKNIYSIWILYYNVNRFQIIYLVPRVATYISPIYTAVEGSYTMNIF